MPYRSQNLPHDCQYTYNIAGDQPHMDFGRPVKTLLHNMLYPIAVVFARGKAPFRLVKACSHEPQLAIAAAAIRQKHEVAAGLRQYSKHGIHMTYGGWTASGVLAARGRCRRSALRLVVFNVILEPRLRMCYASRQGCRTPRQQDVHLQLAQ